MNTTSPSTCELLNKYRRLLPIWADRCGQAQTALSDLIEMQEELMGLPELSEIITNNSPGLSNLIENITLLDLVGIGYNIGEVDPYFDFLGELGKQITEDGLIKKATNAWFRSGGTDEPGTSSRVYIVNNLRYVELSNANGVLAVYRASCSGKLRRLRNWPKQSEGVAFVTTGSAAATTVERCHESGNTSATLVYDRNRSDLSETIQGTITAFR